MSLEPERFGSVIFSEDTNPQHIIDCFSREANRERDYAKQGIIYGSAWMTDLDMAIDGVLEAFEEGLSVEDALEKCYYQGYSLGSDWGYPEDYVIQASIDKWYEIGNKWHGDFIPNLGAFSAQLKEYYVNSDLMIFGNVKVRKHIVTEFLKRGMIKNE